MALALFTWQGTFLPSRNDSLLRISGVVVIAQLQIQKNWTEFWKFWETSMLMPF